MSIGTGYDIFSTKQSCLDKILLLLEVVSFELHTFRENVPQPYNLFPKIFVEYRKIGVCLSYHCIVGVEYVYTKQSWSANPENMVVGGEFRSSVLDISITLLYFLVDLMRAFFLQLFFEPIQ